MRHAEPVATVEGMRVRLGTYALAAALALPLSGCGTQPDTHEPPTTAPTAASTAPSPQDPTKPAPERAAPRASKPKFRPVVKRVKRKHVRYSYAPGCPVGPKQLRRLQLSYWGFDGQVHRGALVVAQWAVATTKRAFRAAFRDKFRIRSIHPVERYYRGSRAGMAKSDARTMSADNTSAFNCRYATGSTRFSAHSWGDAIDVNPRENPHVLGGRTYPRNGAKFADRSRRHKGMLRAGSAMTKVMRARGWTWGGTYRAPDYQHFSRTGR